MSDSASDSIGLLIAVLFVAGFFVIGICIGRGTASSEIHIEAVKLGVAEWAVDEIGVTTFKWKVKP